jgi:hypothetical protein
MHRTDTVTRGRRQTAVSGSPVLGLLVFGVVAAIVPLG